MAEEKVTKGNVEKVKEEVKEEVTENVAIDENELRPLFLIEREKFVSKDKKKSYWSYFIKGTLKGREVKVDLEAKDAGGYELLDLIFEDAEVYLNVQEEKMTDERGKVTRYMTYEAFSVDASGFVYSYKVKPSRESDKAVLTMLLAQLESSSK